MFDEDLRTMEFEKVKKCSMRVNGATPIEIGAKFLAIKNGEPELWR
jgi:hypothetical protein